jgi:polyhydroxyalkanoate synthase
VAQSGRSLANTTWDDYVEKGVIEAIRVVQDITGEDKLNMFGFCVGGTIVSTALAVLAARGEQVANSLTLLTTFLDFSDTGVLDVFVDEAQVALREQQLKGGGLMPGRDLASTFSSLRPNDLVWNYVQSNYLKGNEPAAFDLLYWNSDSTNLPGPMFCWYLRNTYLENKLKTGKLVVAGETVDLSKIDAPAFIYGSREDHIVPWQSAYDSLGILKGKNRFVLGASGHIAGVINSPVKNKRSYWINDSGKAKNAEAWMGRHRSAGQLVAGMGQVPRGKRRQEGQAKAKPGNAKYKPIEAAGPLRQGESGLISQEKAEKLLKYKFGCVAIKAKSYIRLCKTGFFPSIIKVGTREGDYPSAFFPIFKRHALRRNKRTCDE